MANVADVDALDFEPDDDDLMDEDAAVDVDATSRRVSAHIPKLKSAITGGSVTAAAVKKTKGRGFREETDAERNNRMSGRFDSLASDGGPGPERLKSPKHLSHNMPTHLNKGYVAAVVSKIRLSRSLHKNQLSTEINHFIKNVWLQLQLLRKSICFLAWHNQKTANVRLSACNLFVAMVVESIDLSLTSWSVNGSKM
ncbi:putative RNA-binding motif protein [Helianthus debilis subsp. tardiflorus]